MKRNPSTFQGDTILTPDNLALVTDLTCGFDEDQAKRFGYDVVSFSVNVNYAGQETAFLDGNESNDAFTRVWPIQKQQAPRPAAASRVFLRSSSGDSARANW